MNDGGGRLFQSLQRPDHGGQFHAVVGGCRLTARQFLFVLACAQDRRPAAGSGVSRTGAVGKDVDARLGHKPYSAAFFTF